MSGQRISGHVRRRNARRAEAEIVVFELERPCGRQRIFYTAADGPTPSAVLARTRENVAARVVVDDHVDVVLLPRGAALGVKERRAERVAQPPRDRAEQVGSDATIRCKKVATGNAETGVVAAGIGPAQVGLGAKHHIPNLIIGTDLTAADEGRAPHIIAERHRSKRIGECGIFKRAADVSADIEAGPVPRCRGCWRRRGLYRYRQIVGPRRAESGCDKKRGTDGS